MSEGLTYTKFDYFSQSIRACHPVALFLTSLLSWSAWKHQKAPGPVRSHPPGSTVRRTAFSVRLAAGSCSAAAGVLGRAQPQSYPYGKVQVNPQLFKNIIFSPMPITGNPFSIAQVYVKLWWNMHRSGLFHGAEGKRIFINLIAIFPSVQLSPDPYKPHRISNMLMWESQELWQTGYVISRLTRNILLSYYGLFNPHILVFISKEMMRNGQLLHSFKREIYRDAMENNSIDPCSEIQGTIKQRINIPGFLSYEKRQFWSPFVTVCHIFPDWWV